jgi:hypothetical protein
MSTEVRHAGIPPSLPGALGRCECLNGWIPAERVAALRIATGVVLLLDLAFGYWSHLGTLLSAESLGGRDLFAHQFRDGHFFWSILRWLPESWGPTALLAVWTASAVALVVGWRPIVAGLVAWACAVSFASYAPWMHNGGDRLRATLFLMIAASSAGAVWGLSSLRRQGETRPVVVPAWPVTVLLVQLTVLYFFSGVYKLLSEQWRSGYVMYYAAHDLAWCLTPAQSSRMPVWFHQISGWVTLFWELGFPLLVAMRGTRAIALGLGVIFHAGTFLTLEVGAFALYAIACYAAFVPWERLRWPTLAATSRAACPEEVSVGIEPGNSSRSH